MILVYIPQNDSFSLVSEYLDDTNVFVANVKDDSKFYPCLSDDIKSAIEVFKNIDDIWKTGFYFQ